MNLDELRRYVGDQVKSRREAHGWSMRGLAGKAHIAVSYLHDLEHGVPKGFCLDKLHQVAVALGVPLRDLFPFA